MNFRPVWADKRFGVSLDWPTAAGEPYSAKRFVDVVTSPVDKPVVAELGFVVADEQYIGVWLFLAGERSAVVGQSLRLASKK